MAELRWILLGAGLALIAGLYLWGVRGKRRSAAIEPSRTVVYDPLPTDFHEPARLEPQVRLDAGDEDEPFSRRLATLDEADAAPGTVEASPSRRREPTLGEQFAPTPAEEPLPVVDPEAEWEESPAEPIEPLFDESEDESQTAVAARAQRIVAFRVTAPLPSRFEGSLLHEAILEEGFEFGRYEIFHRLDASGRPLVSLANLREPGTFEPATMAGAAFPGVTVFAVLPGPVPAERALDELVATSRSLAGRLGGTLQDERGMPLNAQRVAQLRVELLELERALAPRPGP
jgi:cell division protein ZipA